MAENCALSLVNAKGALLLRLRLEAERCGMTELSRRCGIEGSNLYKVLADDANPTLDSLIKITTALGLQIELKSH